MSAASEQHDLAITRCLSSLLNPAAAPILHAVDTNMDGGDPRTLAFFNNDRRWLAAAQACLPVVQGGLGLSCAKMTGDAAYVAGWVDYLRFLDAYPGLFPARRKKKKNTVEHLLLRNRVARSARAAPARTRTRCQPRGQ